MTYFTTNGLTRRPPNKGRLQGLLKVKFERWHDVRGSSGRFPPRAVFLLGWGNPKRDSSFEMFHTKVHVLFRTHRITKFLSESISSTHDGWPAGHISILNLFCTNKDLSVSEMREIQKALNQASHWTNHLTPWGPGFASLPFSVFVLFSVLSCHCFPFFNQPFMPANHAGTQPLPLPDGQSRGDKCSGPGCAGAETFHSQGIHSRPKPSSHHMPQV